MLKFIWELLGKKRKSLSCNTVVKLQTVDIHEKVDFVYIAHQNASDFFFFGDAHEWNKRVSQNSKSVDAIRQLLVIGALNTVCNFRKHELFCLRENELNFIVDEVNQTNDTFFRFIENGKNVKIWWVDRNGILYGGNTGVSVFMTASMKLERGEGKLMVYEYSAKWKSKKDITCTKKPDSLPFYY